MHEFQLIERFFKPLQCRDESLLAIGDDAALVPVLSRCSAHCLDTLVEGRHFLSGADPFDIAWKAVATNVSDLMAMGAQASFYLIGLTLPAAEERWLQRFSEGLQAAQAHFEVCLLGGDTTGGTQVVVTVSMFGEGRAQSWLRRGAAVGDGLYVTGRLGEAALGLQGVLGHATVPESARLAQLRPQLPLSSWEKLLNQPVHAAIDISDGLVQDAGHMAKASEVALRLYVEALPLSDAVRQWCIARGDFSLPLCGGEDYQLLLAMPKEAGARLAAAGVLYEIGEVVAGEGVQVLHNGRPVILADTGFKHF